MTMRAGKLDKRLEIQESTETQGSDGGVTSAWATIADRWAQVIPRSSWERWRADAVDSAVTHMVRMRYFPNLDTETNRFLLESTRVLNIASAVDVDERHEMLEVMVIEPTGEAA